MVNFVLIPTLNLTINPGHFHLVEDMRALYLSLGRQGGGRNTEVTLGSFLQVLLGFPG